MKIISNSRQAAPLIWIDIRVARHEETIETDENRRHRRSYLKKKARSLQQIPPRRFKDLPCDASKTERNHAILEINST